MVCSTSARTAKGTANVSHGNARSTPAPRLNAMSGTMPGKAPTHSIQGPMSDASPSASTDGSVTEAYLDVSFADVAKPESRIEEAVRGVPGEPPVLRTRRD